MKKLILFLLMALSYSLASAQENTKKTEITDGSNTLYIINGVVSNKSAVDELPSSVIKNMDIVTGVDRVIIITTKERRHISGRVVDVEGKPITGVVVLVPKTHIGTVTDIEGAFNINLPAGEDFLTFAKKDYPTKTIQIDKDDIGDIVMDKKSPQDASVILHLDTTKKTPAEPLCIMKKPNGELSKGELDSVSPNDIKSISIFKDRERTEPYMKYGDTSKGVVLIELK